MKASANSGNRSEDRRRRKLAAIHVGRRRLKLDDETYRALLVRVTGKATAAELSPSERAAVIDDMRRCGFRRKSTRANKSGSEEAPQILLIRWLFNECVRLGALKDGSDRALDRFVRRTAGIDSLRWLTPNPANKVIEGLKAIQRRAIAAGPK
jgi:phage gp16-like protein